MAGRTFTVRLKKGQKKFALPGSRAAKGGKLPVAKLTKPVKRAVNRLINSKFETKYVADYIVPISVETGQAGKEIYGDTYPTAGSAQVFPVLPDIAEGNTTNEYTRAGVKISPTKLYTDVSLYFNNLRKDITGGAWLDNCAWDITVHIWYGYCRKYKQTGDITANSVMIAENLLDLGDGTTARWAGLPNDNQKVLNKEYMVGMKHKMIRMYRPFGSQNDATVNGGLTTYFPEKLTKTVRLHFKTPKTPLLFNEANVQPENYAPFFIIGYQHNDNTQAANTYTAPGTTPADPTRAPALLMAARSHLWFKDA